MFCEKLRAFSTNCHARQYISRPDRIIFYPMWCRLSPPVSVLAAVLGLAGPATMHGHGDVHGAIVILTRAIADQPSKAALHFERASLYAQFDHFPEALADLAIVETLQPVHDPALALRGNILRRSGKPAEARAVQETFLKKMPQDARVRFDYCQTLADLQETAAALRELDHLMAASPAPSPDTVALRLRLTESTDAAAALTWLETFLAKHPLPVFQEEALRLEIKLGRTAAAVQRLDAMIATAPRPESLHLRKASLLAATGDQAGAQSAARAALTAIARLPVHLRSTRACTDLAQQAKSILSP